MTALNWSVTSAVFDEGIAALIDDRPYLERTLRSRFWDKAEDCFPGGFMTMKCSKNDVINFDF